MRNMLVAIVATIVLASSTHAFQTAPMTPTLKVGDKAPDFSLPGTDGKTHSLAEYKGKFVVLAWYPKAMTTGCTQECKSITENGPVIKSFDVAYFMASVDTPDLNRQFAERDKPDFPLLSDPEKKAAMAYGVVDATHPLAQRWTFFIGPDGKLVKVDTDSSKHTLTAGQDLIDSLTALKVPKKKS